jgi:hypothetical protein
MLARFSPLLVGSRAQHDVSNREAAPAGGSVSAQRMSAVKD